jgi:hypothetical protein
MLSSTETTEKYIRLIFNLKKGDKPQLSLYMNSRAVKKVNQSHYRPEVPRGF